MFEWNLYSVENRNWLNSDNLKIMFLFTDAFAVGVHWFDASVFVVDAFICCPFQFQFIDMEAFAMAASLYRPLCLRWYSLCNHGKCVSVLNGVNEDKQWTGEAKTRRRRTKRHSVMCKESLLKIHFLENTLDETKPQLTRFS